MDRKQKKLKKSKKSVRIEVRKVWYRKHFVLEVLYCIPYVYITIFRFTGVLIWKSTIFVINWVKTHSTLAADLAKTYVFKLKSGIKIPKIPVPEIELSRLKTPNFDIKKFLISEYKGLKQEIKDLFDLLGRSVMSVQSQLKRIGNIRIEFPKIEIPQITFKIPEFKLPELKLSLPKIPKRAEVKTPKVFEAEVKLPENPLINFNFDLVAHLRTSLKSLYSTVIRILLWPFKTIYRVIKAIFSIEIRFRLFSFRTFLLIAFIIGLYLGTAFYFIVWRDLPRIEALSTHEPRQTTTIYDRKGNILYRLYDDEDRTIVPLESIPRDFINATIAIEDEDFFTHNGLSVRGILRAAKKTFFEDDIEGGSTITQQLVKNSLLTSERTYERKAKEAVIAIEVERKYSKKQILEMYLNRISYGGTAYGIKSAAKRYFGKEPGALTLAESSFLAGLPVAPSKYSPFAGNLEAGKERQRLVLDRMVASGFISQEAADTATEERLEFKSPVEKIIAPHFVNYVISELENKYGQLMVAQGGLDVFTSIDMELQTELENIVEIEVSRLARNNVSNGAALITDPKTGEVLAMVGSTNYWDTSNDGNVNITISPRQPGSSIKPLTYSLALENGYTLSSILDDTPVVYKLPGQKDYKPVNYDGRFHGRVTIRQALANSYNVPAVKMLDKLGVSTLVEHGQKMGITTWNDPSRFGLSLTLGAGEVKMTDMAVLYGVFANQGYKRNLNPILKIYDAYGNVIEENDCVDFLDESPSILTRRAWFETNALASTVSTLENKSTKTCQKEKVLSEFTSYMISNTLSDNRARASAFGANSELNITKRQFAVKTGTTNNEKDNWAIGYNDDFVVVTWVGNNYNEPMRGLASGYVGSSTIWRKAIDYLIENRDMAQVITRPAGLIEVDICPLTNTLACSGCPNVKQLFEKGKEPQVRCDPKVIEEMLKNDEEKENEEGQDENSKASDNQD